MKPGVSPGVGGREGGDRETKVSTRLGARRPENAADLGGATGERLGARGARAGVDVAPRHPLPQRGKPQLSERRLRLITTDDNVRALELYQRFGLVIAAIHEDGVARSRLVKPSIPLVNEAGVPIRHELELELPLDPPS